MGEWPFQIQATAWARTRLDVISTASCVLTNLRPGPSAGAQKQHWLPGSMQAAI